jgi:hypothetical protein
VGIPPLNASVARDSDWRIFDIFNDNHKRLFRGELLLDAVLKGQT